MTLEGLRDWMAKRKRARKCPGSVYTPPPPRKRKPKARKNSPEQLASAKAYRLAQRQKWEAMGIVGPKAGKDGRLESR